MLGGLGWSLINSGFYLQTCAPHSLHVPGAGGDDDVSGDLCGTNLQVQGTGDEAELLMLFSES